MKKILLGIVSFIGIDFVCEQNIVANQSMVVSEVASFFTKKSFESLLHNACKVNPRIAFDDLLERAASLQSAGNTTDALTAFQSIAQSSSQAHGILYKLWTGYDRIQQKEFVNNFREQNIFYKSVPLLLEEFINVAEKQERRLLVNSKKLLLEKKPINTYSSFEEEMEQGLKDSNEWLDAFNEQFNKNNKEKSQKVYAYKVFGGVGIGLLFGSLLYNILKDNFSKKVFCSYSGVDTSKIQACLVDRNVQVENNKSILFLSLAGVISVYVLYNFCKKPTFNELVDKYLQDVDAIDFDHAEKEFYNALKKYGYTSELDTKRAQAAVKKVIH